MKKTLLFAAMAALMASCANEETVQVANNGNAIGFDSFVGKVTRAGDVTSENLASFYVYGGLTAEQFNGTEVTKSSGSWAYTPVQYWESGETYKFAAIAPRTDATYDLTTLKVENYQAGENDLIVATASATAKESDNQAVQFTFKHALAKVQFSFTSGSESLTVTNAKVSGVNSAANLEVTAGTSGTELSWKNAGTPKSYDVESTALYLLPQSITGEMVLSFTYDDDTYTVNLNTATAVTAWENGQSYSYNVNLATPESIEFSADVASWTSTDTNLYPATTDEDIDSSDPNVPGEDEELVEVEKTVTLTPEADTIIRGNGDNKGNDVAMEIDGNTSATDFMGLIRFTLPDNLTSEAILESAELRLVTVQCKGERKVKIYDYKKDFEESTSYNAEGEEYINSILATSPVTEFSATGLGSMSVGDDKAGNWTTGTDYTKVENWTNLIDLKDHVNSKISESSKSISLLLQRDQSNSGNKLKLATKEAVSITNDGTNSNDGTPFTFEADDLKPQLTIKYKVKEAKSE